MVTTFAGQSVQHRADLLLLTTNDFMVNETFPQEIVAKTMITNKPSKRVMCGIGICSDVGF